MEKTLKNTRRKKTCENNHEFYKSSDCPVCPKCELERKATSSFVTLIAAPARRALERQGITSLEELSSYSKAEILQLHGIGPNSLPKLEGALRERGLSFK